MLLKKWHLWEATKLSHWGGAPIIKSCDFLTVREPDEIHLHTCYPLAMWCLLWTRLERRLLQKVSTWLALRSTQGLMEHQSGVSVWAMKVTLTVYVWSLFFLFAVFPYSGFQLPWTTYLCCVMACHQVAAALKPTDYGLNSLNHELHILGEGWGSVYGDSVSMLGKLTNTETIIRYGLCLRPPELWVKIDHFSL